MNLYETKALQVDEELNWFIDILKRENVRSYLEIGSKYGGSLWRIGNALSAGSRVVAVDMPYGDKSTIPHLMACRDALQKRGLIVDIILGDSTDTNIIKHVFSLGPFDACLIDANHLLPYVTKDWENYGRMARIVAFHDIAWKMHPGRKSKTPIEVPQFWKSIRGAYRHEEISLEPRDNGIGVLWRDQPKT